ncbi:hypothetical protein [Micromonospora chersina]
MIEERVDSRARRAYGALAFGYAVAWCLPASLAAIMNGSEAGSTPGHSYVDGRLEECIGQFGCPSEPVDIGAVLQGTALILAPSLLLAVPLCAYLARKWRTPALAGFVAAATGWTVLCVGGLVYFNGRVR